jgi:putative peptidoglycan lipid II flippase
MKNAVRVAGGIFLSRIFGFLREAVAAFFFGVGPHADVFRTALRIPNLLQNLLGEQTLSASFIPGLSRMLEEGRQDDARRFSGAVFGLLVAVASAVSVLGIVLARPIVIALSPGYLQDAANVRAGLAAVDRLPLAVEAVRWTFPMVGFLVLSAWALTVLNSHRRFFLPYVAPVLWNSAIIGGLVWTAFRLGWPSGGARVLADLGDLDRLLIAACVGGLIGGGLQFAVQLPTVLRLLGGLRPSLSLRAPGVRQALAAFWPLLLGRGVIQLTAFLDLFLASLLAAGAQGALGWGQTLYILPVSLFGMSVAAAELPELSRQAAGDEEELQRRVQQGLRQMAYLTVPTTVGYLLFGPALVGAVYQRGNFGLADTWLAYLVLAGFSIGLVATTISRLLQNVYFAFDDTRRPARVAVLRVGIAAALGVPLMLMLDRVAVADVVRLPADAKSLQLGAVGLSLAAGSAAWVELAVLYRGLRRRLPGFRLGAGRAVRLLAWTLPATLLAAALWWLLRGTQPTVLGVVVVAVFGMVYVGTTRLARVPEAMEWQDSLRRSAG